jgi:hypothetical protein
MLLAFAQPAFARDGGTLDSILPEIRAQHPGRLSDAEPFTAQDGSTHYRIKWMTPEGRILYFDADARSGRYFNSRGDDGGGAQWRRGGDDDGPRWNNGGSGPDQGDDDGGRRSHWNGSSDHWNGGSGDWHGGGDNGWRNHDRGDGRGDWHGGQGSWGNRGGDWRGGHNGGDNGGRHHHGG